MQKRFLGNTGIEVSEVAFGGVEIGIPYGIGVGGKEDMLSESDAVSLLHSALDRGVNFFDTARMYGESERIMGNAFADRRDRVVIATKCRHLIDSKGNLPSDLELRRTIEDSLTESLKTLGTDYVDVFMLHQADMRILENDAVLDTFARLRTKGLYRASGVSTYTVEETRKTLENDVWNMLQLPFNLMDQRQAGCFAEAARKGVGIVIRSVLLKGLLSCRGKNLHPALSDVEKHISEYDQMLQGTKCDLPTMATKFALSFDEVSAVLVGIDKMEYLENALATADGNYLDDTQLAEAQRLAYPDPEFLNLPYWDRMNWLK